MGTSTSLARWASALLFASTGVISTTFAQQPHQNMMEPTTSLNAPENISDEPTAMPRMLSPLPPAPISMLSPIHSSLNESHPKLQTAPNAERLNRIPDNGSAPTVVIRPSVTMSRHLNDCVVDVQPSNNGDQKASLRIMVPDSIGTIEVVPNQAVGTSRSFRVQMTQTNEVKKQVVQQTSSVSKMHLATKPTVSLPVMPKHELSKFRKNPFFQSQGNPQNLVAAPPQELPVETYVPLTDMEPSPAPEIENAYPTRPQAVESSILQTSLSDEKDQAAPLITAEFSSVQTQPMKSPPAVSAKIIGPSNIGLGDIGEYSIYVTGPVSKNKALVEIELGATDGLEIIVVNREPKIDNHRRSLSWQFDQVDTNEELRITYRVKAIREGNFTQHATISIDGQTAKTLMTDSNVKLGYQTTETAALPFE